MTNRWHIYNHMKRHWYDTGHCMTAKEVIAAFPGTAFEELAEGMIEFQIVYEQDLRHQAPVQEENTESA